MPQCSIREASLQDISTIVHFLSTMQKELNEFDFNEVLTTHIIKKSLKEHVYWFLFIDENNNPFGTCYMQSLHNYWRTGKRYHIGGFYIAPHYRGKGYFKTINTHLQKWAEDHDGVQIFAFIHEDNVKSLQTFASVGITPDRYASYKLCAHHWDKE